MQERGTVETLSRARGAGGAPATGPAPASGGRTVRRRRAVSVAVAASVVLAVDQVTKALAVSRLSAGPVGLLGPLRLELAYNRGVAFSLLSGLTVPIVLLVLVLVAVLTRFARSVPSIPAALAVGAVLGGALGNLADRLVRPHGEVVDFLYTGFWPTFNLADAAIVVGGCVLALSWWRHSREAPSAAGPGADGPTAPPAAA